jgi:hypothetical protein
MKAVQTIFRVFYKSILLSIVVINFNPKAFWIIPISVLISLFTEIENLTK